MAYYKINKEKHDIIYKVLNKKILDSAEKCFNEDNCKQLLNMEPISLTFEVSKLDIFNEVNDEQS